MWGPLLQDKIMWVFSSKVYGMRGLFQKTSQCEGKLTMRVWRTALYACIHECRYSTCSGDTIVQSLHQAPWGGTGGWGKNPREHCGSLASTPGQTCHLLYEVALLVTYPSHGTEWIFSLPPWVWQFPMRFVITQIVTKHKLWQNTVPNTFLFSNHTLWLNTK